MAYDPLAEIESLKEQQKQKSYSDLEAQKNNSLSQLNQEKSLIQPQYYKSRNTASTASQLQAKNFAEYLANRSLSSSGTAAQAELTRNVGLQGQIGNLNRQENLAYDDINRRTTDVNNNFNTSLTSAYAGVDSDINAKIISYKEQLAQEERQREFEAQQAAINREFQARQAAASRQASAAKSSQPTQSQINAQQKAEYEKQQKSIYNEFYGQGNDYDKGNWLNQYRTQIINTLGADEYQKMVKLVDYNMANNIGDLRQTEFEQQQDRQRQRLGE